MKDPELTLIIPTYHEEHRIGQSLEDLADYLSKEPEKFARTEVVVIDGNSDDRTREIAQTKSERFASLKVENLGQKGKGRQIKHAMLNYSGRYLLFMDADLATPLHHVDEALEKARAGAHVVVGVRDLSESHKGLARKVISWGGNFLVQLLILPGISDTQCGFKLFEHEAAREIFGRQRMLGWSFDMEVLAIAKHRGYKIEVLPIPDWRDVAGGTFSAQAGGAAVQTLKDLFVIRLGLWSGRYRKTNRIGLTDDA
jgi:dolichyl-phosphate beta-glucosyltransferase